MSTQDRIAPVIAPSFLGLPESLAGLPVPLHRVMLVGDSNTMPLFGAEVGKQLGSVFREVGTYTFPAGEEYKTLDSVRGLLAHLIDAHFDRKDCVAALGGGVVGDMAGFAASVFLRGIPVIQIPTTLLAQIDSSIGGKTGVDFDGYKNMVGSFHMPALVYTNPSVLTALPDAQFRAGMGEVVKSALLADAEFFGWLRGNSGAVLGRREDALLAMIRRTAGIKAGIVRRDPTEQGERALLNLGHTIGHAVEKARKFTMLHGDCVALGLHAAAYMSLRRGMLSEGEYRDIVETCALYGLPDRVEGLSAGEVLALTKSDKKMSAGQIRFILLETPGKACMSDDVTDEEMLEGIRHILA